MIKDAIHHHGQFNIIHPASGLKVDVIIKQNTPFDNSRFRRIKRIYPAESYQANFAAPEDVIIKKMECYREKKWNVTGRAVPRNIFAISLVF
ncbi:MAG: hypothetical protein JRI72_16320 [Deltaproteobacteria bacterium]|nr:hypothetical protein [Deltaproteobacteria bacterium]